MWQRFSERARKQVYYAQGEAQALGLGYVDADHLILGAFATESLAFEAFLEDSELDRVQLREAIQERCETSTINNPSDMTLTPIGKLSIDHAYTAWRRLEQGPMEVLHLVAGVLATRAVPTTLALKHLGVDVDQLCWRLDACLGTGLAAENVPPAESKTVREWVKASFEPGAPWLSPESLLLAMMADEGCRACKILCALNVDFELLRSSLEMPNKAEAESFLRSAVRAAFDQGDVLDTRSYLLGILSAKRPLFFGQGSPASTALGKAGVSVRGVKSVKGV